METPADAQDDRSATALLPGGAALSRRRKVAAALLGAAVSAVFAYIAVRDVEFAKTVDSLSGMTVWWVVPAFAVFSLSIALRAWRWQLLFVPTHRPAFAAVGRALLVSYFFNNLLPARAGEAARIVALHSEKRTPRTEVAATVVTERLFDVVSLLVLLFVCLPSLPEISWLRKAAILAVAVAAAVVGLVAVLAVFRERAIHVALRPLHRLAWLPADRLEHAAVTGIRGFGAMLSASVAIKAFAATAASWVVMALSFWLLSLGFGFDLPVIGGLLVVVTINLSLVIPSSAAAIGVFEAAVVVALNAYGIEQSRALSYGLVLHAMNFVPFVLIGLWLMPWYVRRRQVSEVAA